MLNGSFRLGVGVVLKGNVLSDAQFGTGSPIVFNV